MLAHTLPYQLLVADESNIIRSIFTSLPTGDVRVRYGARTRNEFLSALNSSVRLDAIICDFNLSGALGGVKLLAHLRETNLLRPETAFILMTGDNRKSNLMPGVQAKPDAIVLKPFTIATLMEKLQRVIGMRRGLAELSAYSQEGDWTALLKKANERLAMGVAIPEQVHRFKAQALAELGQTEDLASMYEALLAAQPNLGWVQEELARQDYNAGYVTDAADRLLALVERSPAQVEAHKLLAEIQHDFGNIKGMQVHLEDAVRHAGHEMALQRELGHVALFNGDLIVANKAYQATLCLGQETGSRTPADVVNAIRVLLLQDEHEHAIRFLADLQGTLKGTIGMVVLNHFVRAAIARGHESLGIAQRRVLEALQLMDEASMEDALAFKLLAVESCLIAGLARESHLRSEALLESIRTTPPHAAIRLWATQLNSWARQMKDDTLPHGFLHYRQKIK